MPAAKDSVALALSLPLAFNLKAYTGEFNHTSAIAGLEPLRSMLKSNEPAKKKMANHMLKTSAILSMIAAIGSPYQLMTPPALTSMR